jgi:hypothetical protein
MMKFSFPSTFIIPCSVFYGSLFSDIRLRGHSHFGAAKTRNLLARRSL